MPFQPFQPPPTTERHHVIDVRSPAPVIIDLRPPERTLIDRLRGIPRWLWWLISIAAFVIVWWVSMDFRGLVMVLGVFWFFALGVHPATAIARTGGELLDGDE